MIYAVEKVKFEKVVLVVGTYPSFFISNDQDKSAPQRFCRKSFNSNQIPK